MRIYFILTAILVISSLTIPFAVNMISIQLTATELSSMKETTEAAKAQTDSKKETIKIRRGFSDEIIQIDMLEYIGGTVAGERPASFSTEALKAQAVA